MGRHTNPEIPIVTAEQIEQADQHPFPEGMGPVPYTVPEMVRQITRWQDYNFYPPGQERRTPLDALTAALGLGEEAGEVQRAVLKRHQGIRGTAKEWEEEAAKELGDVFIKAVDVAESLGLDFWACVQARWLDVRARDLRGNPAGHGLPKD